MDEDADEITHYVHMETRPYCCNIRACVRADVTQNEILLNLLLVPSTGWFLHGNSREEVI